MLQWIRINTGAGRGLVVVLMLGCCLGAGLEQTAEEPRPSTARMLEINRLVDDLRNDSVRFNASDATYELWVMGREAWPALEAALESNDWQQRQMAAYVLCRQEPERPSEALLRVCVEALADDALPLGHRPPPEGEAVYNFVFNANTAIETLLRHTAEAEPWLAEGLVQGDRQKRFLCAFILASAGYVDYAEQVVP
ncbi:MAG: hypothetical protein AAGA25_06605 [Planctomycetota bacterium]